MNPTIAPSRSGFVLEALHEARDKEGRLTRENLQQVAARFGMSATELSGVASFYHYLRPERNRLETTAVCRGPVCTLSQRAFPCTPDSIPCPGLCDQEAPRFESGRIHSIRTGGLTPPRKTGYEVLLADAGVDSGRLAAYLRRGGYQQLLRLRRGGSEEDALALIERSGLVGRGGAAFPAALKLKAVRSQAATPKYLVCNADEGEPGTFKDRPILHLTPHRLLEGMAIAGRLAGASAGILYLRYEYPEAHRILSEALEEARGAGLLGGAGDGTAPAFDIRIVRGAGSYVCGEETALVRSLEGKMPWPQERPPYPTESGLFGQPTAVQNVETLANLPLILERGASWFRGLGSGVAAGTKIYSLSGCVLRPGNYELPLGTTARELIFNWGEGIPGRRHLKAFTLGGISGGLLGAEMLDLPLDYDAPQSRGAALGSGGMVVLDEACCTVEFVRSCLLFYERESCGRCIPCRIGTVRLREIFDSLTGRAAPLPASPKGLREISEVMEMTSACGLGRSAPILIRGLLRSFAAETTEHLERFQCRTAVCSFSGEES